MGDAPVSFYQKVWKGALLKLKMFLNDSFEHRIYHDKLTLPCPHVIYVKNKNLRRLPCDLEIKDDRIELLHEAANEKHRTQGKYKRVFFFNRKLHA